jgi:hypothetical protein
MVPWFPCPYFTPEEVSFFAQRSVIHRGAFDVEGRGDGGVGHFAVMDVYALMQRRIVGDCLMQALSCQLKDVRQSDIG